MGANFGTKAATIAQKGIHIHELPTRHLFITARANKKAHACYQDMGFGCFNFGHQSRRNRHYAVKALRGNLKERMEYANCHKISRNTATTTYRYRRTCR
jgi:hypothetical protein